MSHGEPARHQVRTQPQERDVSESRPNPAAPYHCGLNGIGRSCALGPTPSGRCCQEQWVVKCGESACANACQGAGKCQVGQLKHTGCEEDRQDYVTCIPIKNSWYSRNSIAVNLALLTGGLLLVFLVLPNNESIFAPGSLSRSHSQILGNTTGVARCSTCHPNSHTSTNSQTQEQLCMNCHQSHMKDAIHGFPHDLHAEHFARLVSRKTVATGKSEKQIYVQTEKQPQADLESGYSPKLADPHWRDIHTRCAECHQEHHADSRSLQAITDARCQSCHQQQFDSFSNGHPEFRQHPEYQPRRLAFDHLAHLDQHFPKNNTTFDCSLCHQASSDRGSEVVKTVGFERACASCHDSPLKASTAEGWALIQLPSLNSKDIQLDGSRLAHWPAGAQYGYDGPITLAMRLLLSADSEAAAAINHFPKGDLSQAQSDNVAQQAAARTIAAAVRQLLFETAEHGQAAWEKRLTDLAINSLGRELVAPERELIQSMVTGLPPDLFRQIAANWFSGREGVVHHARSTISASLVSLQEGGSSSDSLLEDESDNLLEGSGDDLLGDTSDSLLVDESDSLLGSEEADNLLRGSSTQDLNTHPTAPPPQATPSKVEDNKTHLIGVQHLGQGGWFLDSRTLSVRYMLRGHADPILAAWIQYASLIQPSMPDSHELYGAQLSVGQCTECHLLPDSHATSVSPGNWMSLSRNRGRRFTHFEHGPHLTLAGSTNCQTCHRIDESRPVRFSVVKEQLKSDSPGDRRGCLEAVQAHFRNEFHSIEKAQCNACHRPGGAPQGCTQCHNYHVSVTAEESH